MNRLWFDKYHLTTNLVIEETIKRGKKRVDKEKKRVDKEKKRGRRRRWRFGAGGKRGKRGGENACTPKKEEEAEAEHKPQRRPLFHPPQRAATTLENGVRVRIKCPHPGAGTRLEVRPRFDPR